ncbi:MAG: hypothetical protein JNL77_05490 [Nitrosomonas sp.]|nr:hypothetical protein [Nitrosomonas sp.]
MVRRKDKDKMTVAVPGAAEQSPKQAPVIPVDEFHGLGGSYVIDPATGKRTRVAGPDENSTTEQPEAEAVSNESE